MQRWLHKFVNIFKTTELYTLKGYTVWSGNCISVKLLIKTFMEQVTRKKKWSKMLLEAAVRVEKKRKKQSTDY